MTQNIIVSLSDQSYRRIKRWAEKRNQDMGDAIADFLAQNLPDEGGLGVPPAEADPDVAAEKAAYLRLYSELKAQYAGQYVAIHGGQLVDHDVDYGALFERVDDRFPDSFVWLTRVEDEPIGTLSFRSPRFVENDA